MSRTYKDRPYKVRVIEAYREGRFEHDHSGRDVYRGWAGDRELSARFYKSDAAEIHAYREFLRTLNDNYRWEEVERNPYDFCSAREANLGMDAGRFFPWRALKTKPSRRYVEFRVSRYYEYDYGVGDCDIDMLNPNTNRHIETGKYTSCGVAVPRVEYRRKNGRKGSQRSLVRQNLRELARDPFYDELDETDLLVDERTRWLGGCGCC